MSFNQSGDVFNLMIIQSDFQRLGVLLLERACSLREEGLIKSFYQLWRTRFV